ncbi:class I SAM-dependent methyltransferase [Myxococcota bacterium]|nr:class I SAM-dependent methyltransferase [Myxococcota bacterium]
MAIPLLPEGRASLRAWSYNLGPAWYYDPAYRRIAGSLDISRGAILDVGCGPGWVCIHAAAGNPELDCVGIDQSATMISIAERNRAHRLNITFKQMQAEEIIYPDDTFDRVVAVQTMHHWREPDAILAEIKRVTRPGGVISLWDADPSLDVPSDWIRRRGLWPPNAWVKRSWRRWSLGDEGFRDMTRRVEGLGFAEVKTDTLGFYRRIVATK